MSDPKMPELWWSPSGGGFLARHENGADEHLVWIVHMTHESLRHHLGTGPDSNPPLPADAVRLVALAEQTWQWGWRLAGVPDAVVLPASEATARKQAELDPDTEAVRRRVGEWGVVDRG